MHQHGFSLLTCMFVLIACCFTMTTLALADDITYTGSESSMLQDLGEIAGRQVSNALAPGGGTKSTSLSGNNVRVKMSDSNVLPYVFGGVNAQDSAPVTGNNVFMESGKVFVVQGGLALDGASTCNTVTISGGQVFEGAVGGSGRYAIGNTVTITGGVVSGDVYGGRASDGDAMGNTVVISGTADLRGTLYGGCSSGGGDARTGNSLKVKNFGLSAEGVANFAKYHFDLPTAMTAGQTMLSITNAADISDGVISVGLSGGLTALNPGDRVTLLNSAGGLSTAGINTRALGVQGIATIWDFDLTTDPNNLYATLVSGPQSNPQLKSLSEGRLAGLAFVSQGADLIVGPGMHSALLATERQDGGFAPFATVVGGASRYNTGSHVDVDGFSMLAGLAWRSPTEPKSGSFLAGAFFEAGWGNYNSHNSFNSLPSVNGDGDVDYQGGGVLARYDAGPGGFYGEASFRAGHVSTDFSSDDLLNSNSKTTEYDSDSVYYGAHAGVGYFWGVSEKVALDFSTKYIWTHQDSDSVTVSGDDIDFKAADSQRWRSGARLSYAMNEHIVPYMGAYYDHEFDGRAQATANNDAIDSPDLRGGTGVGELGLSVKPFSSGSAAGLAFDLGVQGYTGVREGVTGSLQAKFEF